MSGRRTRTVKASASSSVPTRGSSKDKENRDDLRVIATGSLLGDGQRWKKKYLSHSEVSTTTASLPAAADEKSAGYCGGDTRPRRHSSKASSSEGRQDSFVLAKEQVHINRTLTNPKASVSDLINVAKTNRLMFNTVNWATLFHRLARFHAKEAATNYRPEIKTLLHQCRLEEDCSCQHLANLSWAMAKLRIVDMVLLHSVVEKSLAMSELMNPPDVTNLCWSLAKSRSFLDEPSQFHELEEIVNDMFSYVVGRMRLSGEAFLAGFKPVELSSVMWAMATTKDMSASVMEDYSEVCDITAAYCVARLSVDTFPPASLASLAWALSQGRNDTKMKKNSRRNPGALTVLMKRSSEHFCSRGRLLFKLKAKDLSELLWAIVGCGVVHEEFLDKAYHSIELVLRTSQKPFDASAVPGLLRAGAAALRLSSSQGTGRSLSALGPSTEPKSCSSISTSTTESARRCPMSRHLFEKLLDAICDEGIECCSAEEKNHLPESIVILLNHFNANDSVADNRDCFDKCSKLAQLLAQDFLAREGADWTPHGVLGLVELAASTHLKCQHIIATFNSNASTSLKGAADSIEDFVELLYVVDTSGIEIKWEAIEAAVTAVAAGASLTRRGLARLAFLAAFSPLNALRILPRGLMDVLCSVNVHTTLGGSKSYDGDDAVLSRLICENRLAVPQQLRDDFVRPSLHFDKTRGENLEELLDWLQALSRSDSTRSDEVLAEILCELLGSKDELQWSDIHTLAAVQGLDRMSPGMLSSFVFDNLVLISQRLEELSKSISPTEKVLAEMTLDIVIRVIGSDRLSSRITEHPRDFCCPVMF